MEKSGIATFTVIDNNSKKRAVVSNDEFLTSFQEKQMSHQPDFILEYAKYLGKYYNQKGFSNPSVYVDCFVTLNLKLVIIHNLKTATGKELLPCQHHRENF